LDTNADIPTPKQLPIKPLFMADYLTDLVPKLTPERPNLRKFFTLYVS